MTAGATPIADQAAATLPGPVTDHASPQALGFYVIQPDSNGPEFYLYASSFADAERQAMVVTTMVIGAIAKVSTKGLLP